MWKVLPATRLADAIKLIVFVAILAFVGNLCAPVSCARGPSSGEIAVSDWTRFTRRHEGVGSTRSTLYKKSFVFFVFFVLRD